MRCLRLPSPSAIVRITSVISSRRGAKRWVLNLGNISVVTTIINIDKPFIAIGGSGVKYCSPVLMESRAVLANKNPFIRPRLIERRR